MRPTEVDATRGDDARAFTSRRRSGRSRAAVVMALLVAVVAAGVGGLILAAGRAQPAATAGMSAQGRPVVTIYDPNAAHGPQATATPRPCDCEAHTLVRPVPPTPTPLPSQLIVVSLSKQWLWAYQGGQQVFDTPVTTGQPGLETPMGTFSIQQKLWDIMFYSPWPQGSPYYYSPEHIDFAMLFLSGGYFIHDATWRHCFGPGTNVPHTCPDGTQETGSHGCVNVSYSAGQWLINWVRMGTTVRIVA